MCVGEIIVKAVRVRISFFLFKYIVMVVLKRSCNAF